MSTVRKRKTTSVYIDDDQLKTLRALSKELEVTMAAMIRRGIDLAIDWYEERKELLERNSG